jgi:hypothetical protein
MPKGINNLPLVKSPGFYKMCGIRRLGPPTKRSNIILETAGNAAKKSKQPTTPNGGRNEIQGLMEMGMVALPPPLLMEMGMVALPPPLATWEQTMVSV